MQTVRLLLILAAALLLAGTETRLGAAPPALADADVVTHHAEVQAFGFDGGGTLPPPVTEEDSDFAAFSETVNAFDDPNDGRSAEGEATQDTTVDFTDPIGSTVDTSGTATASWTDPEPGDGSAPSAQGTSDFTITFEVTNEGSLFSLVGSIEATADTANANCTTVNVTSPDGTTFGVSAPAVCGSSQESIDESGELGVGTYTFSVVANARASNPNATGGSAEASFDLSLTLGCGITVSSGSPEDDTDGDNIPNGAEENIGTSPYCQDTDGDGLLDSWEVAEDVEGAGFDLDDDGDVEVTRDEVFGPYAGDCGAENVGPRREQTGQNCGLMFRPDPLHKDVYVEIDWQDCFLGDCPEPTGVNIPVDPSHHSPDMLGLLDVVNVFRSAPVDNPDDTAGVNLNILVDEAIPHIHNCDQAPAATRETNFGTVEQREDVDATRIIDAKEKAFRYGWSGHSSIKDHAPGTCPLPEFWEIIASGAGVHPLPEYDISPHGHVIPGGRDIIVSLAVTWICQLYTFDVDDQADRAPPCFRQTIVNPLLIPGLFPARIAQPNGGSVAVARPIHMMLGIPNSEGVQQLWGRSFANLLGYAIGVPPSQVGNDPNTSGRVPPESYGSWEGLAYAPPDASAAATVQGAADTGFIPIFPDFSLADEDADGDGAPEGTDNCPGDPNADQQDLDGDGQGDLCDLDVDGDGQDTGDDDRPNDTDNDGTDNDADADDDGDGAPDAGDNCPKVTNDLQENADGDAAGDSCDGDDDDDGLPDVLEEIMGSDAQNAGNSPEFLGFEGTCSDAVDNDEDGDTDNADDGCSDADGDTVPSSIDNCPALETNNVLDSDGDGTGDVCETEGDDHTWGDNDCDGEITSRDNQALQRKILQQPPLSQTQPCPALGDVVAVTGIGDKQWGDLDCDGEITSRDNQAMLRKVLQQPALSQTQPCPLLGDPVTTVGVAAISGWKHPSERWRLE